MSAPARALVGAEVTGVGLAVSGVRAVEDLLRPTVGDFEPSLRGRGMRHKDRASKLALVATAEALRDAGADDLDGDRVAVVVSSNFGNLDTACEFTDIIHTETVTGISPMRVPHMSSNVTACWVAIEHGLRGPNLTLCSGTASGLDAVSWARNLIAVDRADVAVVIGVEPDTEPVARLHRANGGRRWLDGAVALVVESTGRARRRGARVRARVGAYGRGVEPRAAVEAALGGHAEPVDLYVSAPGVAGLPAGGDPVDLTDRLGRCSGALGVLQCAAAVAWFDAAGGGAGSGAVLAVAGAPDDGEGDATGSAALVLTGPRATRQEDVA
ncbi:beta-ketoacyl synthase N-terminal-like domain-containing protein [Saccharothrix lopnurensis]|uniref:Beta-ketoacyl synthase N-terminal-like domain-containing protein n=1 Tax=Saccharothrix lopnurensis TaxID=1670621 RepID=A0ABW1P3D9_9PSEU